MNLSKTALETTWFRYLIEADLPAVLAIERDCATVPRTRIELTDFLRPPQRVGLLLGQRDRTLGWLAYEPHRHRLDLLELMIAPWHRRQGLGHYAIQRMVNCLDGIRRTQLAMVVSEKNLGGQLFLQHEGFRCVAIRPDPGGGGDDRYLFLRGIHDTAPVPIGPIGPDAPTHGGGTWLGGQRPRRRRPR